MSYDTKTLPVKGVEEGYNYICDHYESYHDWLDSFDKAEWRRYLPRKLDGLKIADIGAGDGRTYHWFADCGYESFYAVDVAESLLKKHPGNITKVVADAEGTIPLDDDLCDLITMFFVVEHIHDIDALFSEVFRLLAPGGRWIFTYFPQRREFIHEMGSEKFKIEMVYHRVDEVLASLDSLGGKVRSMELLDDRQNEVGRVYCIVK